MFFNSTSANVLFLFYYVTEQTYYIKFLAIKKKKECSNYCTITLISHASKIMLKILQARYVNRELLDMQIGFRKGRGEGPEIKLPKYSGS